MAVAPPSPPNGITTLICAAEWNIEVGAVVPIPKLFVLSSIVIQIFPVSELYKINLFAIEQTHQALRCLFQHVGQKYGQLISSIKIDELIELQKIFFSS